MKEPKIYFFDSGLVNGNGGARLENFVAGCLLKHVFAKIDYEAERYSLHYLQTKERKEVDFALACEGNIQQMIEVKRSDPQLASGLLYFHEKYQLSAAQIVKDLKREKRAGTIDLLEADHYLKSLML